MPELSYIFKRHGSTYLEKFTKRMLPSHIRAINDISKCRTAEFGCHIDSCKTCGYSHIFFHSCCNRSCPKCHASHTQKWFDKSKLTLLPVQYFHVVFTLPDEMRNFVRSNQTPLFNCLFKAAAYTLSKLMADSDIAGGKPGMLAVLHTWSRTMEYHPHVHFLLPAGVISTNKLEWIPIKRKRYLIPVNILSDIFRAKFMKLARKALPQISFPQSLWKKKWVVYSKAFKKKGSEKVLEYLARYVHRIAITNNRILSEDNGKITFKYQNSTTGQWKEMALPAFEFMRRFLQHVLPKGFHKVRYYGFLSPNNKKILHSLQMSLISSNRTNEKSENNAITNNYRRCPKCKTGMMTVIVHIFFINEHPIFVRPPPCKI